MSEMAPEAWVPELARCTNCGGEWHAFRLGPCETSCLAQVVIFPRLSMPLVWEGDCA